MVDFLLVAALSNLAIALPIAAIAWAVHRGGRYPQLAHILWVLVLVKLITPPLIALPVGLPAGTAEPAGASLVVAETTPPVDNLAAASTPVTVVTDLSLDPLAVPSVSSPTHPWGWASMIRPGLLVLWGVGSVLVLAGSLWRIHRFGRLLRQITAPAPPPAEHLICELADRLGLRAVPRLCVADARVSPMTWWAGGPVRVVIPRALLDTQDPDTLYWVLAHELAHVKRRDHLVRWVEWLACVGFWWNPLAWWARRNLRMSEEACCDALVMSRLCPASPRGYAKALIDMIEWLVSPALRPPAMASEINSGGFLERRLTMILTGNRNNTTPRWLVGGALAAALVLMPLGLAQAAMQEQEQEQAAPEHEAPQQDQQPDPPARDADISLLHYSYRSLTFRDFQQEIGLTGEQAKAMDQFGDELRQLQDDVTAQFRERNPMPRQATRQRRARLLQRETAAIHRNSRPFIVEELAQILSADQIKRLNQAFAQVQFMDALRHPAVARQLGLAEAQQDALQDLADWRQKQRFELSRPGGELGKEEYEEYYESLQAVDQETMEKALEILNDEQQGLYAEMQGEPVTWTLNLIPMGGVRTAP